MYKVDTYFYESVDKYAKEEYTNTVVKIEYRGVEQLAARRAHNPKVVSSSLTPATKTYIVTAIKVVAIFYVLQLVNNNAYKQHFYVELGKSWGRNPQKMFIFLINFQ